MALGNVPWRLVQWLRSARGDRRSPFVLAGSYLSSLDVILGFSVSADDRHHKITNVSVLHLRDNTRRPQACTHELAL